MPTIVRNVRDLDKNDRFAMERVVGQELREGQRLVINVETPPQDAAQHATPTAGELPEWCNIYAGLSDDEIDELDRSITRTHSSREFS
ncbi:MAG: hypothetical protein ACR2FY_14775 [Pirellulaceae bacterium]